MKGTCQVKLKRGEKSLNCSMHLFHTYSFLVELLESDGDE